MPRIAMLVVAVAITLGASIAAQVQPQTTLFAARPTANLGQLALVSTREPLPVESSGRVELWQNRRLLAEEAAALAAAQAKARAAVKPGVQAPGAQPPAGPIPSYPPGSIQNIITTVFTPLGPTAVAWGLRVARCESGYNPRAYNGAGPYYGLFQFLMSTFKATPFGGQNIYDPTANASAAAWKYSRGGAGSWGCK
jgi:soluble lytic murein transglycosylase-like protein